MFYPDESSMREPGSETLPAETGAEDPSVPAAAHRYQRLLSILLLPAAPNFDYMQLFYWQREKEALPEAGFYFVEFIGCCVFIASKWTVREAHPSIQLILLTSFIYFFF